MKKQLRKNKVKHAYPPWKNDIIWGYPVNSSFACNSMKILIDNIILITIDREHHATSYHRSVWVQRCTFLSSYTAMGKGGIYNFIFSRGGRDVWPCFSQLFFHKNVESLCSSDRKFPEFFKTHKTFVFSSLLMPSTALWTLILIFLGTPCI